MLLNNYSSHKCPDAEKSEIFVKENEHSSCPIVKAVKAAQKAVRSGKEMSATAKPELEISATYALQTSSVSQVGTQLDSKAKSVLTPSAKTLLTTTQQNLLSPENNMAATDAKPLFTSELVDDRSIHSRFHVSPIARMVLALLISFHGLGQTPGIGGGQSLSDFEISNKGITLHKSGLALNYDRFLPVDKNDRPVYSI